MMPKTISIESKHSSDVSGWSAPKGSRCIRSGPLFWEGRSRVFPAAQTVPTFHLAGPLFAMVERQKNYSRWTRTTECTRQEIASPFLAECYRRSAENCISASLSQNSVGNNQQLPEKLKLVKNLWFIKRTYNKVTRKKYTSLYILN